MRVVSHTCSNTEIVCALGEQRRLVGVDTDSDFPPQIVEPLAKLGRDLELDITATAALKPDLVLTSLTVPGHERIVEALKATGLPVLVIDPIGLDGVYDSIMQIAEALGVLNKGRALAARMQAQMPPIEPRGARPKILVEWWPKPVIAPARLSWINQLVRLAGGVNPFESREGKSAEISDADAIAAAPDAIVMSWCGVKEEKYRPDVVARRPGWSEVPAVKQRRIVPITEAFLGRPGPRLVEGYAALAKIMGSESFSEPAD
ncbi:MAG TPA: ABC transporter substrate-binding protein [Verrucomicrobiae bacterium]|nr:ABC transporter substrate-binding protein [Verrucomicrobiae bacterium]